MRSILTLTASAVAIALAACATAPADQAMSWPRADIAAAAASVKVDPSANVFLKQWTGPFDGTPAFDKMDLAQLKPALEAGMAMNLAEIDAIANNPAAPTFDNTILALEDSGRDLSRVFSYYGILGGNLSTPEFRAIQQEMAPKLADFGTRITQNEKLFARVQAVYESPRVKKLRPDQQ
ncbi:MAG: M3 family peptidase, partial [Parvularculaceae bacterium]